jgi:hypothetical protein
MHSLRRSLARGVSRALAPLHERRHRAVASLEIDREALLHARETWWGRDRRWYPAGTAPRRHNRVTPLVDGATYFDALHRAVCEAQHYVNVIGWCMTPHIPLQHCDAAALVESWLHAVLVETARRLPIRILLWSGAPFLFEPNASAICGPSTLLCLVRR